MVTFKVVRSRIQIYLYVKIIPQLKIILFWLKFQLNGKTIMSIKYEKLQTAVRSIGLRKDVRRRYMWWIMIQVGER